MVHESTDSTLYYCSNPRWIFSTLHQHRTLKKTPFFLGAVFFFFFYFIFILLCPSTLFVVKKLQLDDDETRWQLRTLKHPADDRTDGVAAPPRCPAKEELE